MSDNQIHPFPMTEEFVECWNAAGRHLDLRVKDTGARWLRAELPVFREHFSFSLGNQLFFIQVYNVDAPENGWLHKGRLEMAIEDANGVGCLMPMRYHAGVWQADSTGWGLLRATDLSSINPIESVSDEPVYMNEWEIHDYGLQVVRQHLVKSGWNIDSWISDPRIQPALFAEHSGKLCGFVISTSNKGPDHGARPDNASQIAERLRAQGFGAKFVGLKVGSLDDIVTLDPRLQHLTRKLLRGGQLIASEVEIQDL